MLGILIFAKRQASRNMRVLTNVPILFNFDLPIVYLHIMCWWQFEDFLVHGIGRTGATKGQEIRQPGGVYRARYGRIYKNSFDLGGKDKTGSVAIVIKGFFTNSITS